MENWHKGGMRKMPVGLRRALFAGFLFTSAPVLLAASDDAAREPVIQIVSKIRCADYEGDRHALKGLYEELAPFTANKSVGTWVRYWRGFAMWRRAINGFNDSVDPKELEQDLTLAVDEFKEALAQEPAFVEAKIGLISCLGYLAYVNMRDPARAKELMGQITPLTKEAKEAAPENPRLLWVLGPILWNTPADRGGGQDKAIANYEKGLELCRKSKATDDRLEPSWCKPELLMNLAWSKLAQTKPDLDAAERNARSALELVPSWHYVRDILMAQILSAKEKAAGK